MNRNKIIIICESPIFNHSSVKAFPELNIEYSVYLNSLLLSNWVELLADKIAEYEKYVLLSREDEEFLTGNLIPKNFHVIFHDGLKSLSAQELLQKETSNNSSKILLVFFNSIGLRDNDIQRTFNLVNQDEVSIVVAKLTDSKLIFNCCLITENYIIDSFMNANRDFNKFFNSISERDVFIHMKDRILSIDDFEDIKKLYIELSKKDSLAYCSKTMHESFNDLFIEYKDLLNV